MKKMLNSLAMFCSLFTLFPLTIISSIVFFFRLALDNTSEIVFHVCACVYIAVFYDNVMHCTFADLGSNKVSSSSSSCCIMSRQLSPCGSCRSDGSHTFPGKICQDCPSTFCS